MKNYKLTTDQKLYYISREEKPGYDAIIGKAEDVVMTYQLAAYCGRCDQIYWFEQVLLNGLSDDYLVIDCRRHQSMRAHTFEKAMSIAMWLSDRYHGLDC